ncbi:MAG: protein rep [Ruminiclostridium sp.]|nr:protein rep [Ruminiclostridium sp.]
MKNSSTTLRTLQEKKNRGYLLAASFERLGYPDRAKLVVECGTYLGILDTGEGAKIVEANFCKQRLCPACNWRRSLKIYGALPDPRLPGCSAREEHQVFVPHPDREERQAV